MKNMMNSRLFLFAVAALAVVGCQRPNKSGEQVTSKPGDKLKVVYIPKNTGNPYFNDEIRGFEEACKDLKCDFFTTGPATGEATSQIPFIKDQIQRGVDIIAITPNSPDALNPVLDEAKAKGILVVTVDADLVANEEHRAAAVLPTDFTKIGENQVELMGSLIGYEGEIAILSATSDAPNQNVWIAGMKGVLDHNPKYSKMKLVDVVYGDDQSEKSTTEFEALLSKHANLRGVIAPTSVGLAAAAASLEVAGVYPGGPQAKGAGLQLTGLSTPNQLKKYVENAVVTKFQLWSPYDMGYLACQMAYGIRTGTIKPSEGVEFEAGKLGKRMFGKNNVVITGPLITFEKANIGDYDF
jgi:rhamnose transport system substrate-binding protein